MTITLFHKYMKSGFKLTALLAAGLIGYGIAPVQPPLASETLQQVLALTPPQISTRAEKFTVLIGRTDGEQPGSGAIVGRNGNQYAVLTNSPSSMYILRKKISFTRARTSRSCDFRQ